MGELRPPKNPERRMIPKKERKRKKRWGVGIM